jgi:crotonobetainyl-CoA:carnitine CoA-transferase CaiB-like acyl-CoA transferase
MVDDPRFKNDMDRFNNAFLIDQAVKEWIAQKTVNEVVILLREARVPCSVINDVTNCSPILKCKLGE